MERTLDHLMARGWLDDRRFALSYTRYRAGTRRYGRYRIVRELRHKGLAEEWIEEALAEVLPTEKDERALVRKRIQRRLRREQLPYSEKVLRSLYASLLRAGFSSAIIRSELFGRTRRELPAEFEFEEEDAGA